MCEKISQMETFMLCLTSKSYQLCKPRQADIWEQLHGLGSKTDVDIVTLNLLWRGPQLSIYSRLRSNPVGFEYCAFLRTAFVAVELLPQQNSGRLNVDQNPCFAQRIVKVFVNRKIENKGNRETHSITKYDTYICLIQNPQFFDVPVVGETEHANRLDGWLG